VANNYQSNINKKLLKSFADGFDSSTVILNTVSKQLVNDFDASTGGDYGQVSMKRPPQYVPQRTSDGDLTSASINPVRTGKVQAEVSDYVTVYVENTQVEEALEADQLDELLKPISEDMVVEVESEAGQFMATNASLTSGDPDLAIDQWSDVANAGALLKDIGCPAGKKYGLIDCFDEVELANLQTQLGVNPESGTAWADALIKKNFAGLDVMTSNNLPQYTSGNDVTGITLAATPSSSYTSYKDTYRMALTLAGFTATTGTLGAGTTLEFGGTGLVNMRNRKELRKGGASINLTLTVLPDTDGSLVYTADGSGNIVVQVSGAAIYETGVDGAFNTVTKALASADSITIRETADTIYRPGLAYHEGFIGVGSVVLPKLHATDSMVMNHKNMSIRVHRFSDGVGNKNRYRFDILPTFACFNPAWGVRMNGFA
jgi:hypothetical protein